MPASILPDPYPSLFSIWLSNSKLVLNLSRSHKGIQLCRFVKRPLLILTFSAPVNSFCDPLCSLLSNKHHWLICANGQGDAINWNQNVITSSASLYKFECDPRQHVSSELCFSRVSWLNTGTCGLKTRQTHREFCQCSRWASLVLMPCVKMWGGFWSILWLL